MRFGPRRARVLAIAVASAVSAGPLGPLAAPLARAAPGSDAAGSPGAAGAGNPDGAELRRRGNDAMAAFRPGEALEHYKQAYELTRDPALLYNMARALEALQDYPEHLARHDALS